MDNGKLIGPLVSDGGSTDETAQIATEIGASLVHSAKGRGTQLATAAKMANTPWLLFLHADTTLSDGWVNAVQHHIASSQKAAYFRLAFDSDATGAKLTAGWANLRSRWLGLPYGDQGLLIPKTLYDSIGGYPEIPLMEDVAIARKLRGQLIALNATATTSAAKYEAEGYLKRGSKNLITLARYLWGTRPETLAKRY